MKCNTITTVGGRVQTPCDCFGTFLINYTLFYIIYSRGETIEGGDCGEYLSHKMNIQCIWKTTCGYLDLVHYRPPELFK